MGSDMPSRSAAGSLQSLGGGACTGVLVDMYFLASQVARGVLSRSEEPEALGALVARPLSLETER